MAISFLHFMSHIKYPVLKETSLILPLGYSLLIHAKEIKQNQISKIRPKDFIKAQVGSVASGFFMSLDQSSLLT